MFRSKVPGLEPLPAQPLRSSKTTSSSSEAVGQIKSPSGGLPHSEIPGSKGALASPGLIAECHVLHRLLSPRHPPNALLALDPIQKRKDRSPLSCRKSYFPQRSQRLASEEPPSVSVLDLERLLSVVLPRFALLEDGSSHSSKPGRRTSIEPHWNDR